MKAKRQGEEICKECGKQLVHHCARDLSGREYRYVRCENAGIWAQNDGCLMFGFPFPEAEYNTSFQRGYEYRIERYNRGFLPWCKPKSLNQSTEGQHGHSRTAKTLG